jgi:serine/threonine-protein kinase
MPLNAGTRIGVYEITSLLGAEGMGEVYRARDSLLNRDVAIRVLPEAVARDPERLARFTRDAQTLAALNHPNIAEIYAFEIAANALVMELVTGKDLFAVVNRRAMRLPEALFLARQFAAALESAHDAGVIHLGLNPANIKVRADNTVKVLDFGLATVMDPPAPETAYMSPEQARGEPVDRRADIWAFGAVFYEMLSGRQLRDPIDWLALPRSTPATIQVLLARCLDGDVTTRLPTIGEARLTLDDAAIRTETRSGKRGMTKRTRWLAITGALLAFAAIVQWPLSQPAPVPTDTTAPVETAHSLAVLPFVNGSGNQDDEYFADGVTDELIAGLGKVPGLRVAGRTSAFSFKGHKVEIRAVAQKLDVDSVLEGSVSRSGQGLRVTASLFNAKDGLQVWSNTFESSSGDAFAVQDEVTRAVAAALALPLGDAALQATRAGRTTDPVAHDLYKRGVEAAHVAREPDLRRALGYFQQAIDRDPKFALAYTGLAWTYASLGDAYLPPIVAYPKARTAAQAALALDDRISEARALVAYSSSAVDWDAANVAVSEREFQRALDLDPNSVNALTLAATHRCFTGQFNKALDNLNLATKLDPLSPRVAYLRELCDYLGRRYPAVIEDHRKTTAIDPSFAYFESWAGAAHRELGDYDASIREYLAAEKALGESPQYGLALTYRRMGWDGDARYVMRRMDEEARTRYVSSISRAIVHGHLGDIDGAARLLEQAVDHREGFLLALRNTPDMKPLVDDPRTRQILDRADAMRKE